MKILRISVQFMVSVKFSPWLPIISRTFTTIIITINNVLSSTSNGNYCFKIDNNIFTTRPYRCRNDTDTMTIRTIIIVVEGTSI